MSYVPSREPNSWYLAEGDARIGNGGFFMARETLQPQWHAHFEYTQTLWPLPLLERLANNEIVETQEIFDAYRAVYGENPPRKERNLYV